VQLIIKREGIAGLYSGIDSALFGISVTNFVYYYCKPFATNRIDLIA
jgi:adenine nucleotide transporter 17